MNRDEAMIDLEHLDRYVSGDNALRDEILQIFVEQADMWASLLDPESGDREWKDTAHALKGASRGVGAWDVGDLCERAERLVSTNNYSPDERYTILAELRTKVHATVAEVRMLRGKAA